MSLAWFIFLSISVVTRPEKVTAVEFALVCVPSLPTMVVLLHNRVLLLAFALVLVTLNVAAAIMHFVVLADFSVLRFRITCILGLQVQTTNLSYLSCACV